MLVLYTLCFYFNTLQIVPMTSVYNYFMTFVHSTLCCPGKSKRQKFVNNFVLYVVGAFILVLKLLKTPFDHYWDFISNSYKIKHSKLKEKYFRNLLNIFEFQIYLTRKLNFGVGSKFYFLILSLEENWVKSYIDLQVILQGKILKFSVGMGGGSSTPEKASLGKTLIISRFIDLFGGSENQ